MSQISSALTVRIARALLVLPFALLLHVEAFSGPANDMFKIMAQPAPGSLIHPLSPSASPGIAEAKSYEYTNDFDPAIFTNLTIGSAPIYWRAESVARPLPFLIKHLGQLSTVFNELSAYNASSSSVDSWCHDHIASVSKRKIYSWVENYKDCANLADVAVRVGGSIPTVDSIELEYIDNQHRWSGVVMKIVYRCERCAVQALYPKKVYGDIYYSIVGFVKLQDSANPAKLEAVLTPIIVK